MSKTVEFWFDVGSPAAYIAWMRLPQVAQRAGARIDYRPMLLGGVFQATGNQSPMNVAAKGRYMQRDLERFAHASGIDFHHNPHFPINTLMLMRGVVALQAQDEAAMIRYTDAVFRAIWSQGRNMNDPAMVGSVLKQAGFEPEAMLAVFADPAVKDKLKAATQEAVERGVFGAPTFFVDGEMYWGQDRLDIVEQALNKA